MQDYNIRKYISNLGAYVIGWSYFFYDLLVFLYYSFLAIFTRPLYLQELNNQLISIGYNSILVVFIASLSAGAVLALQVYHGMSITGLNVDEYFSQVVVLSIIREIAPITTALMIAGRVGASIAAELSTMKVSNQINAIFILNISPIKYLVVPRVLAGVIMLPILVLISNVICILGAYIISVYKLNVSMGVFLNSLDYVRFNDILSSLFKSLTFGLIITILGCMFGFHSENGAYGVGKATINTVVTSCVLILILNYFITNLFMV